MSFIELIRKENIISFSFANQTCRKEKHYLIIILEVIWFLTVEILIYKELIYHHENMPI